MLGRWGWRAVSLLAANPAGSHLLQGQNPPPHPAQPLLLLGGRNTLRGVSGRPASSLLSLFHSLLCKCKGLRFFRKHWLFFFSKSRTQFFIHYWYFTVIVRVISHLLLVLSVCCKHTAELAFKLMMGQTDEDVVCVCVCVCACTYIHMMDYYSAVKKNEMLPFATTWMHLESIMLSKISQRQILSIITSMCNLKNKTNKWI